MRNKKAEEGILPESQLLKKRCSLTWAILLKMVYEADPLQCPTCGGDMKIITFIEIRQTDVIEKILKHCHLWSERSPPKITVPEKSTHGTYEFQYD